MLQITYVLLYCLVSAASFILMHHVATNLPILVVTFVSITTCLVWFNATQFQHIISLYKKAMQFKTAWFTLNIASFVAFYGAFWAMQYLSPLAYITLFTGMVPLATSLISSVSTKTNNLFCSYLSGILVLLISLFVAFAEWSTTNIPLSTHLMATLIVMICSICSSYYLVISGKLQTQYSLSSSEVLALRFHLVTLAGLLFIGSDFATLTLNNTMLLIITGFLVTIIPLYLLQQSIKKIGAVSTAYIMPLLPITTYILSFLYYGHGENYNVMVVAALASLTLIMLYNMRAVSSKNLLKSSTVVRYNES